LPLARHKGGLEHTSIALLGLAGIFNGESGSNENQITAEIGESQGPQLL
jgi:hypothetical protein